MDPEDAERALKKLRTEYKGRWRVWRSQSAGQPWWWYATRLDPAAGIDKTTWAAGPDELRAELKRQLRERQRDRL
jgi:hypothetical protein